MGRGEKRERYLTDRIDLLCWIKKKISMDIDNFIKIGLSVPLVN